MLITEYDNPASQIFVQCQPHSTGAKRQIVIQDDKYKRQSREYFLKGLYQNNRFLYGTLKKVKILDKCFMKAAMTITGFLFFIAFLKLAIEPFSLISEDINSQFLTPKKMWIMYHDTLC